VRPNAFTPASGYGPAEGGTDEDSGADLRGGRRAGHAQTAPLQQAAAARRRGAAVMLERPAELNTVAPEFLAKRPFA